MYFCRIVHEWDIIRGKIVNTLKHPYQQRFFKLASDQFHSNIGILDCNGILFMWGKDSRPCTPSHLACPDKTNNHCEHDRDNAHFLPIDHFQTSLADIHDLKTDDIFMILLPSNQIVLATRYHEVSLIVTCLDKWHELKLKELKGPFQHVCLLQNQKVLFLTSQKCYIYDTSEKCISHQFSASTIYDRFPTSVYDFKYAEHTGELGMCTGDILCLVNQATGRNTDIVLEGFKQDLPCKLYLIGTTQMIILQAHKCAVVDIHSHSVSKSFTFGNPGTPIDHSTVTLDGQYIVYITDRKEIYLHRISDGKLLAWYTMYQTINCLAVSMNNAYVLLGTSDKRLFTLIIADPDEPTHLVRIEKARRLNPCLSYRMGLIAMGLLNDWQFDPEEASDDDSDNEGMIQRRTAHVKTNSVQITMGLDSSSDEDENNTPQLFNEKMYSLTPCSVQ